MDPCRGREKTSTFHLPSRLEPPREAKGPTLPGAPRIGKGNSGASTHQPRGWGEIQGPPQHSRLAPGNTAQLPSPAPTSPGASKESAGSLRAWPLAPRPQLGQVPFLAPRPAQTWPPAGQAWACSQSCQEGLVTLRPSLQKHAEGMPSATQIFDKAQQPPKQTTCSAIILGNPPSRPQK